MFIQANALRCTEMNTHVEYSYLFFLDHFQFAVKQASDCKRLKKCDLYIMEKCSSFLSSLTFLILQLPSAGTTMQIVWLFGCPNQAVIIIFTKIIFTPKLLS